MKRYIKETVISFIQLLIFYIYPAFALRVDPIAAVLIMLFLTLTLSIVLGIISKERIKFLYPIAAAIVFLPTVLIYYNESALVHALWYFTVSLGGVVFGSGIKMLVGVIRSK